MDLSKDMMKSMGNDDATLAKLKDIGIQHCKDDKWSDDAIKCMIDAKAMADGKACYAKLTAEQQKSMNDAAQAAMKPAMAPPPAAGSAAPAPAPAAGGSGSAK